MTTKTAVITGANRGLGLEFAQQLSKKNYQVFCCCRNLKTCDDLLNLTKRYPYLKILKMDITDPEDIMAFSDEMSSTPIDLLINNAGIYGKRHEELGELSIDNLHDVFHTNAIAPLKLTEALIPHLSQSQGKKVVAISSKMGSITDDHSGGAYAYRASKAALNILMRSAAIDLKEFGIQFVLLHPGWVKTNLGSDKAPLEPTESVEGMVEVIENLDPNAEPAAFYDYQGNVVPW